MADRDQTPRNQRRCVSPGLRDNAKAWPRDRTDAAHLVGNGRAHRLGCASFRRYPATPIREGDGGQHVAPANVARDFEPAARGYRILRFDTLEIEMMTSKAGALEAIAAAIGPVPPLPFFHQRERGQPRTGPQGRALPQDDAARQGSDHLHHRPGGRDLP
jgi:hypothetical protein